MTLLDLKVGQLIEHPTTGEGKIVMISPRKIKIKYPKSTRTTTFTSTKAEFEIKDI